MTFECEVCHKAFKSRRSLGSHKGKHKNESTVYICPQCGKSYVGAISFGAHKRSHIEGYREHRAKLSSEQMKKAWQDPEKRAKLSEAASRSNARTWKNEDVRKRRTDSIKKNRASEEFKKKASISQKKSWTDEEIRKCRMIGLAEANLREDVHARRSESSKRVMNDKDIVRKVMHTRRKNAGWTEDGILFVSDKEWCKSFLESFDAKPTVKQISDKLGMYSQSLMRKVHEFGLQDLVNLKPCHSHYEDELKSYLASKGINVEPDRSVLDGKELDLFDKDKGVAIEFDGMWWHSDANGKGRAYHLDKTTRCEDAGIRLIHVFEQEWLFRKEAVLNIVDSAFNIETMKIGARSCSFEEVSNSDVSSFIEKNHVAGNVNASRCFALTYGEDIIAVMTFGKPRFDRRYDVELVRFVVARGVNVQGGESKLFKNAMKAIGCSSVLSYCDRSKFTGSGYEKLGFKHVRDTAPSYWWVKGMDTIPRYQTQMKDEDKIMRKAGYSKLYDCGNKVYEWNR